MRRFGRRHLSFPSSPANFNESKMSEKNPGLHPTPPKTAIFQQPQSLEEGDDEYFREQDRLLPIANVSRIMKRGLPDNAKIAKDAKECVQECVSEFISFLTSEGKRSGAFLIKRSLGEYINTSSN